MPSIVVMGVSGSGKTTIGELLAARLDVPFVDGDDLHPPANVEKMRAGHPLDDADRRPWLDAVGARLAEGSVVIACSALKRSYRDRLRAAAPDVRLVFLEGAPDLLRERMQHRAGHYMPASLLDSQLATLEPPGPDEHPIVLDVAGDATDLAARAAHELEETG